MMPLLDTLRVFGIRILHRRSPFSPDRNHIHHLLLDRGFSHRAITLTLVSVNFLQPSSSCSLCRFPQLHLPSFSAFSLLFFAIIAAICYMLPGPAFCRKNVKKRERPTHEKHPNWSP